jgi:hypothetical protein
MKRLIVVSALFMLALPGLNLLAQEEFSTQSVSLQPVLWLDNLIPTELVGVSGQYELGIVSNKSAVVT